MIVRAETLRVSAEAFHISGWVDMNPDDCLSLELLIKSRSGVRSRRQVALLHGRAALPHPGCVFSAYGGVQTGEVACIEAVLQTRHQGILVQTLFPEPKARRMYRRLRQSVGRWRRRDVERIRVKYARFDFAAPSNGTLLINAALGGGGDAHARVIIEEEKSRGRPVSILTFDPDRLSYVFENEGETITHLDRVGFETALSADWSRIVVNSLVTVPQPQRLMRSILGARGNATLHVHLHDYYPICPSPHLLDSADRFCGVPPVSICALCQRGNPNGHFSLMGSDTMTEWRAQWAAFLQQPDEIVLFSDDARKRLFDVFPDIDPKRIKIRPHSVPTMQARPYNPTGRNIAIFGTLSVAKGRDVAMALERHLRARRSEWILHHFGGAPLPPSTHYRSHGPYVPSAMPDLLAENDISVCFLPSIVPETFSLVTHELLSLSQPVVVFDVGAQAEAVKTQGLGEAIPLWSEPAEVVAAFERSRLSRNSARR